ncbi:SIR2 family NAD-dependent protein deacylase [Microscilla marina]|uniref:protein acetyllysine N-acetyltransferase n=1 Tax=Microscilla marina ATCC 23134 TaxID=313606 RepID=A1ZPG8_MICM2|nr:Sir2 family NAD-dependent protein deacetylase [Microscilla marina]EAY27707.1 NAD-dependent deacetylase [Microscilla marina ATCC 23134]
MEKTLEKIKLLCAQALAQDKLITFLTGAGISAESGVPTYRGTDGIWVEGSRNYKPEEFATLRFFKENPAEVWKFVLYRKVSFRDLQPNAGHLALASTEVLLPNNFRLITQNIDRLHIKAGNTQAKVLEIHGNMETVRCSEECSMDVYPFPLDIGTAPYDAKMITQQWEQLKCPDCGSLMRPNVLMFDEYYNERLYKQESAIEAALNTGVLFVVGTSGATNLPHHIASTATYRGSSLVDINIADSAFTDMATSEPDKLVLRGTSGDILPQIKQLIQALV